MRTVLKRLVLAMALVIGLASQLAVSPVAADEPLPTPAPNTTATAELASDRAPALFERDLGPSDVALDAAAPVTDTVLAALDSYLVGEKSTAATSVADAFGSSIPSRPAAASTAVYLPMVGGLKQALPGPVEPAPDAPPAKSADVTVVAWPTPGIRAARDGIISYELRLYNDGEGSAGGVAVTLPFDPGQLTPVGSDLDRAAGDWVSEVRANAVIVRFGPLGDKRSRVGYVYFRVGKLLADNTVLSMRPTYEWTDARGSSARSGNWAPVLVGAGNDGGAYLWMLVQPVSGLPGELRTFYSNRFAPGEVVTTWLNTPRGVIELDITTTADATGQVWLDYRPGGLLPGSYQLVAYGNRSRLAGVATFIVR